MVICVRAAQGLVSGLSFPSVYALLGHWSSPAERATLMTFVYAGIPAACVANFPLASLLCETGVDGGWPMVFYVPGFFGLALTALIAVFIRSRPGDHPDISQRELEHLEKSHKSEDKTTVVPWTQMLRSPAVMALTATHICSTWGFYLIVVNLPLFAKEVFHFDVLTVR